MPRTTCAGGAQTLHGGGSLLLAPFYFGLYGGSELSGVLDSDERQQAIYSETGYRPAVRSLVLQRDLGDFRPPIDRQQILIRRQTSIELSVDPPSRSWWEACLFEPFDRTRAVLVDRGGAVLAAVNFWNMETMAGTWRVQAAGMAGLEVADPRRRQGLATYLLGEALRQLHARGVSLVEVHVEETNAAARALFERLGFEQVDAGTIYRKV